MGPLIEITTVPIQIEMKSTNARLERASGTAELEFSRSDRGVSVRSRSARVNLDTYEPAGGDQAVATVTQPRQATYEATYEATSAYTNQGQLLMTSHMAETTAIPQETAAQEETAAASLELDNSELNIRYEMDKLNFDWKFGQSEFEFTPGDIEFTVTQRPEVVIKYVGGPLYVPPSADPNYEGVDVMA